MIKHIGSLTICVVELEDCPEHERYAKYACHVSNRNTGNHIGTVLTNATFEGVDIPLSQGENLLEIIDCATCYSDASEMCSSYNLRMYNFGPIFPRTKGEPATRLEK